MDNRIAALPDIVKDTKDFVLIVLNKSFEVEEATIIPKNESKKTTSDFLSWRELNDKGDLVFFSKDFEKKDKTYYYNINTIIDGKIDTQSMVISSRNSESILTPLWAKNGYILIYEFNKESNIAKVRLEKINY